MELDVEDATPKREPGTATSTRATSPSNQDVDMDGDAAADGHRGAATSPGQSAKIEDGDAPAPMAVGAQTPAEESPAPVQILPTLTHGSSIGVQSEKIADLAPETAVLQVAGTKNVTHALWSPRDPTLLAAAGEALCRLWTIPTGRGAAADSASGHRTVEPLRTVDLHGADDGFYVTAMAWRSDGEQIAVAKKHPTAAGIISIYDKAGVAIDELPGGNDLLLTLLWNPTGSSNNMLLGISRSGDDDSTIMIWDMDTARALEPLKIQHSVADATWTDTQSFLVCGNGIVGSVSVANNRIEPLVVRADVRKADWSRIEHDAHTSTTVLAADGVPGILGEIAADGTWHDTEAHGADITALCFQPLANPASVRNDSTLRRLYATAATDGTVKVWNARRPFECVHPLLLSKGDPALALSFTPDGYLVAAASVGKVLFWNVDAGGPPRASWTGWDTAGAGAGGGVNGHANGVLERRSNGVGVTNGEDVEMGDGDGNGEEDTIPSLSWDADGGKLAFGAKSQVSFFVSLLCA